MRRRSPSRVPPDPIITSMPDPGQAAIIARPTSPSLTIATRDPERAQTLEERLVARPVEQDDCEVLDLHVHRERDAAQVVLRRIADVDGAASLGADRDLVHVRDRRRQEYPACLGRRRDAQRLAEPAGDEADAVNRQHRQVHPVTSAADRFCR